MSGVPVKLLSNLTKLINDDKTATVEFQIEWQRLVRAIEDLQARVTALEP